MTRRQWIALVILGALAVGLLLAVVLVPWGDDAPASVVHGIASGSSYTAREGGEFVIALAANPSTGYAWTAAHDRHVTLIRSRQVIDENRPGAPGKQELTFRAITPGTTTLKLAYARSFEPGLPPAKTRTFLVTVRQ
jgi:predicted secreted protein